MISILNPINKDRFLKIENILNTITFPIISKNNRRGFSKHKAFVLGLVKHRCYKYVDTAKLNEKYPVLLEELFILGDEICPFNFTSIYINKNVVCPKHTDTNNIGDSLIISIGEYTGCNLVINNIEYNPHYQPIMFNGSIYEHYNIDNLIGTKYSLIFYNIRN